MRHFLARLYRRIGLHAAPPGTALHFVHTFIYRIRDWTSVSVDNRIRRGPYGGTLYYDITRQRQIRSVDGLALIFFMGAGDYLMATPLIRALRLAHPDLPIYAYASSRSDTVSSALVYDMLKINPLVDRVFRYEGKPRDAWTNYDFAPALDQVPPNFLTLPVIYDVDPNVLHRTTSLLETFGLPIGFPLPLPIAYPAPLSASAEAILDQIDQRLAETAPKGIVFLQLDTRSSNYEYPFIATLAADLVRRGYLVISFSRTGQNNPAILEVDVTAITPPDTIELLRTLHLRLGEVFVISVNSLLWPISAALQIPNLGLHVFEDISTHHYHYPNIYVVTQFFYQRLSPFHQFRAVGEHVQDRLSADGRIRFSDFKPGFVLQCFDAMIDRVAGRPGVDLGVHDACQSMLP